jgi:hypothetical protein
MGGEYTMANTVTSKTTALDRRARAGGEIDRLAEANGIELAMPWEEGARRLRNMKLTTS